MFSPRALELTERLEHYVPGSGDLTYLHRMQQLEGRRDPIMDALTGRPWNEPTTLLGLDRHAVALKLMFEGLMLHYIECAASGDMTKWKNAGHSVIELASIIE